ncbi:MAG: cytochrome c [Bacteroidia bacterium]|jgi:mono/diheme cytochrome c family protein|nr:cytochrome c [Bacteroidia bacterium]
MNKKVTRIISLMAVFGCVTIGFTSCSKHDPNSPGVEFMPDMYRSPSLEANLFDVIKNEDGSYDTIISNRKPVAGTIARGYMPYPYANTIEGYEAAGANLRNPFPWNDVNLKEGEVLYGKFCVHCHGAGGEGDGLVSAKLPGAPPSYKTVLKTLSEGKIFHSITYGKGLMGSHSGQMTQEERWKVTLYVQKLQGNDGTAVALESIKTDSTAVAVKAEEPKK